MENTQSPFEVEPPSSSKLIKSSLIAIVVAAVILVTIILPAEYGIDPTGLGARMGLTSLSTAEPAEQATADVAVPVETVATDMSAASSGSSFYIEESEMVVSDELLPEGFPVPGELPNPAIQRTHPAAHSSETIVVELDAGGQVEYKAQMERGQVMLYSWSTDRGGVHFDFHADPWVGPEGYWVRYKSGDEAAADHGSLVTPLDGQHGWYFHNRNDFPVTIELNVSGYFDEITHYPL